MKTVWVSHIEMNVPKFDIVYSGAEITKTLYGSRGYEVKVLERWKEISASDIRKKAILGEDWEEHVPKKTAEMLKEMNFPERLRQIEKPD